MTGRNIQKNGYKVLIIDNDAPARTAVGAGLRREGFLIAEAHTAKRAKSMFLKNRPDLIILDVALNESDGFDFIESIRSQDDIPIVVCTVLTEDSDRVRGLESGADDYITKPFSPKELHMRVKTVLRRAKNSENRTTLTPVLEFGQVSIEPDTHEVRRDGLPLVTTAKEFDLLYFLAKNPGVVYSRSTLLQSVWKVEPDAKKETTVTEHIRRLRTKIEPDADNPTHLETVRGQGYRFNLNN